MTTCLGNSCSVGFNARAFSKLLSIYVLSSFPFGFEGRICDLIVSVPDHCLSFYFIKWLNWNTNKRLLSNRLQHHDNQLFEQMLLFCCFTTSQLKKLPVGGPKRELANNLYPAKKETHTAITN